MTEPSQMAREAAAAFIERYHPYEQGMKRLARSVRGGHCDSSTFAQAFAAFESQIRADQKERDAAIVESRMPAVQCMSVEPVVAALEDAAKTIREPTP